MLGPLPPTRDPDPGEGRTLANCGVWLTATGRGHRDTQPPTQGHMCAMQALRDAHLNAMQALYGSHLYAM